MKMQNIYTAKAHHQITNSFEFWTMDVSYWAQKFHIYHRQNTLNINTCIKIANINKQNQKYLHLSKTNFNNYSS